MASMETNKKVPYSCPSEVGEAMCFLDDCSIKIYITFQTIS